MLGDEPLLSISNRLSIENDNFCNTPTPHCSLGLVADNSHPQSLPLWHDSSTSGDLEMCKQSEQHSETDLEKELLNQQCGELQDELVTKDRDLNVLREEIIKSAEELQEARERYTLNITLFS